MKKETIIVGNGRLAVVLFVTLIAIIFAGVMLAPTIARANEAQTDSFEEVVEPFVCEETIVNGGFEARTGWTTPVTEYTADYETDPAYVRTGTSSMRSGIVNPLHNRYSYSSAYQTVIFPKDATRITFSFWLLPKTEEPESIPIEIPKNSINFREEDALNTSDWQWVFLYNKYGQELERLLYRRQNSDVWIFHTFDLTKYASQGSLRLYFDTYNNGWGGVTSMHIDDVSFEACTGTPPPGPITGSVILQGRNDFSGAEVCADDGSTPVCAQTDSAGNYSLDVNVGTYSVTVDMERYLDTVKLSVPVSDGIVTNLDPVTLLGGDTNDDCVVDIFDLTLLGGRFGLSCGDLNWDDRADINNDCTVDIFDLTILGGNFDKSCPVPWS